MPIIEVSDETFAKLREQFAGEITEVNGWDSFVGKKLFIRTVTYHLVGQVKSVTGNLMVLVNASWIADSGRFTQAIRDGVLSEVEPVGDAFVNTNAITDAFPWKHALPKDQK